MVLCDKPGGLVKRPPQNRRNNHENTEMFAFVFNPLTTTNDQDIISPNNINTISSR